MSKNKASAIAAPSLNMYQKIAVIRRSSDSLTYEDAEGKVKSVSVEQLGDAIATATPLVQPRPKLDIPVPKINVVESYERDVSATFETPISYVRYQKATLDEWKERLDYVADDEDEDWLKSRVMLANLSLELMEKMLDLMEKETGFEAIITSSQAEALFAMKIPELNQLFPLKSKPGSPTVKHVVNDVYNYWVQKRSKLKRPLMRQYWPVTSSDDTNPHLVFRPREKEKYKLRKKRQNDAEAYRKMQQLREDFDNLRAIMDLIKRREELSRAHIRLQVDLFDQRLYDLVDTSGMPRMSKRLKRDELRKVQDIPVHYDVQVPGRKAKRIRPSSEESPFTQLMDLSHKPMDGAQAVPATAVAGRNQGEPGPLFVHPLATRERYATSYGPPHIQTFVDSHPEPTFRFRHRPRIGRGGRVLIDRVPRTTAAPVVITAGRPMPMVGGERLLDLLPRPLDREMIARKVEDMALHLGTENDGDEVAVKLKEWLDTDDQLWGEERYIMGPV